MRLFLVAALILLCANVKAQDTTSTSLKKDSVFIYIDSMPQFPGGEIAMYKFLSKNIKYPEEAAKKRMGGRVIVRFTVDKEGNVTDVEILKGVSPEMDEEAMRVVTIMPQWKPATKNGSPVNVVMYFPIVFTPK